MRINKELRSTLMAVTIGTLTVPGANADTIINLGYGSVHSGVGGEFAVRARTDGTATEKAASLAFVTATAANYSTLALVDSGNTLGFETFCIEYNEHFSPGSNYNTQVSPGAIKGGNITSDPVSVGTAYLYSLFATGSLTGYNYNSTTSAGNLQNTIWFLEGERNGLPSGPLIADPGTFDTLLTSKFGSNTANWTADSYNGWTAASFGVAALNMGTSPTFPNQDQLIYVGVPDGGTTLILIGLAMSGLAFFRRKMR